MPGSAKGLPEGEKINRLTGQIAVSFYFVRCIIADIISADLPVCALIPIRKCYFCHTSTLPHNLYANMYSSYVELNCLDFFTAIPVGLAIPGAGATQSKTWAYDKI